jgi:hypothetical protein
MEDIQVGPFADFADIFAEANYTGGKGSHTQQIHGEFIESSWTIYPALTTG